MKWKLKPSFHQPAKFEEYSRRYDDNLQEKFWTVEHSLALAKEKMFKKEVLSPKHSTSKSIVVKNKT